MSAIALLVLVAVLVILCWFLHVITWPLVHLARSEVDERFLSFVTAAASGALGVLFAHDVGRQQWGSVGFMILVLPSVYVAFLSVLLYWTMVVLAGLADQQRGPQPKRFRLEWMQSVAETKPRTRLILMLLLVAFSLVMLRLDISTGYQGWSLVVSAIVAYFAFTIAELGRTVRWFVEHGPNAANRIERWRLLGEDMERVQPLQDCIQRIVWRL